MKLPTGAEKAHCLKPEQALESIATPAVRAMDFRRPGESMPATATVSQGIFQ